MTRLEAVVSPSTCSPAGAARASASRLEMDAERDAYAQVLADKLTEAGAVPAEMFTRRSRIDAVAGQTAERGVRFGKLETAEEWR